MQVSEIGGRGAALCGGGAFLLFMDRFVEGIAGYLFSAGGIVMVVLGLVVLLKNKRAG
jgi:hypothetical protein